MLGWGRVFCFLCSPATRTLNGVILLPLYVFSFSNQMENRYNMFLSLINSVVGFDYRRVRLLWLLELLPMISECTKSLV